jgi:hypothetical protein
MSSRAIDGWTKLASLASKPRSFDDGQEAGSLSQDLPALTVENDEMTVQSGDVIGLAPIGPGDRHKPVPLIGRVLADCGGRLPVP